MGETAKERRPGKDLKSEAFCGKMGGNEGLAGSAVYAKQRKVVAGRLRQKGEREVMGSVEPSAELIPKGRY